MATHNDQKYIRALLNNDSALIEEIYKKCSPQCIKFIKNNRGTKDDAKDIFQNTISYVYSKAKTALEKGSELILTAPICAYLFPIYKGRWYNELKIRKRILRNEEKNGYKDIETKELHKMRYKDNMSSKEIAAILKIDHNTIDQRLYYYKEKLKKCAEQHPEFNDLKL